MPNDTPPPITRVELYPFSYYDAMRKRWMRARYLASREVIAARYAQSRIEGPPEVREGPKDPRIIGA